MRMTRLTAAALTAIGIAILTAGSAAAQGYGPPPGPGYYPGGPPGSWGFVQRRGITGGIGGALGFMSSADEETTECFDCDFQPLAFGFDGHIGVMLNPRLAIMGELVVTGQLIDDEFATFLVQPQLFAALQYWVTPRAWIKGGIGVSSLQVSYNDGGPSDELDSGGAFMGAAGLEVMQAPRFTVDLNLRLTLAGYDGINDQVSTATVGAGLNFF